MLLLTDAAMVSYPDLSAKVKLIENAVLVAIGLGIETPKVAVLAAVETVNPAMQATIDAALLTMMNQRGQIKNCIIDGPLALDLAISKEAARHKGITSDVAGQADILLFHNIEAANSTLKTFTNAANCMFGGVVLGAFAPIVLTSRSDSEENKLYSLACASNLPL
jgi:phosphate butyryltransferase